MSIPLDVGIGLSFAVMVIMFLVEVLYRGWWERRGK